MKRFVAHTEEDIFCMANLYPKRTGLPCIIWVDSGGSKRNINHNIPRLKIQNVQGNEWCDDTFVVSIEKSPKVLSGYNKLPTKVWNIMKEYISKHCDVLLKHWNHEIDEDELKEILYIK